jgi:hypothetical protein
MRIKKINYLLLLCILLTEKIPAAEQDIKKQRSAAFDFIPDPREELITTISISLARLPTVIVKLIADYELSEGWRKTKALKISDLPHEANWKCLEFVNATSKTEQHASSRQSDNNKIKNCYLVRSNNKKITICQTVILGWGYESTFHRYKDINCLGKAGGLTFSPNSKLLAWHEVPDKNILFPKVWTHTKVWDIEKDTTILTIPQSAYPCFFPDSQSILVINKTNKSINIWDLTTNKLISQLIPQSNITIERATIFDNGKIIMALETKKFLRKRMLHIWKFTTTDKIER